MRLLVEADVLIDHITRDRRHGFGMQRLLAMASFGDVELWASAQAVCDAQCVVANMTCPEEARRCLCALLEVLHVCDTSAEQVAAALRDTGGDFEACLTRRAALAIDAAAVVTRDRRMRHAVTAPPVLAPEEVESFMRNAYGLRYDELVLA